MNKRSFSIIVVFIAVAIAGCALVPLLPVKLMPSDTLPSISVSFSMPGNSARAVEAEVTSRLESILARTGGVRDIRSKSYNGRGRVTIDLDRHTDMEKARFEVSALIRQAWSGMPDGVSYPSVSLRGVADDNDAPFMTLTLNAPANPAEIQAFGEENLKPLLARINGVEKVELYGALPMEWRLTYDADELAALGLTPDDIRSAIAEHLGKQFVGIVPANEPGDGIRHFRLTLGGAVDNDTIRLSDISVGLKKGGYLTLDRILKAARVESRAKNHFRINGLNSIYVNITATDAANQIDLSGRISDEIASFSKMMPEGYMVSVEYDATESIREELDKIYFRTALTVLILLLFVGLVSLSIRYVLLITIGLTLNMAVAALLYYISGIEIQLYSLAGITISLNLVIDNLIVMADHYTRRRNRRAFTAILAATLTTIGALSVVFFLDEKTRLSLDDFVTVVIINLAVSLATALFLVPALVERLDIRRHRGNGKLRHLGRRLSDTLARGYDATARFSVRFRGVFITLAILAFGLPVFLIPDHIEGEGKLASAYNAVFGSETYTKSVKPVTDIALGGTLRLFVDKVKNGEYWNRDNSEPVLQIYATLPNGATIEQMDVLIRKMEKFLSGFPEIRQFRTSVSSARRASISVYFHKEHRYDGFPYRLKSEVVSNALKLGGGSWSVFGLEDNGFSNDIRENAGSYRVKLTGFNYDQLSRWAARMRDTLLTHRRIREVTIASEFSYWKDDYSEFYIDIDRDRLAATGITASQLFTAMLPTFGREIYCGQLMTSSTGERINLYSKQADEYDIYSLMNRPFHAGGKTFRLSDISTLEKRDAPKDIVKKNQAYELCLQYEYIGSNTQGEKILKKDLDKINSLMPPGYKAEDEKQQWRQDDDGGRYLLLALVAAIIFFITAILFNSLRQPFAIILMIPISFIGVFGIFYLFDLKFDQGGFASMILLSGITVNAAIYIINEFNSLRRQHPSISEDKVYLHAFRVKIVPIMLTVFSTVLGFIPFLIGTTKESFWYPLAIGTIGGLVMSMTGILIYLPIFILRKPKCLSKKKKGRSHNV